MSHLFFDELHVVTKTKKWEVLANASDALLGTISFRGAWRKYVFQPAAETLYDASCLREIADFTEQQTKLWRDSLKG